MNLSSIYRSLPDLLKPVAKKAYFTQRWVRFYFRLPLLRFLDRFKLNNLNSIYSDEYFLQRRNPPHDTVAEEFTAEVIRRYDPESVADIGCAIGHYLKKFKEKQTGMNLFGIEGAPKAVENALLDCVRQGDLREKISIDGSYEVVMCIEVAEHIHPIYADNLVSTITSGSKSGGRIIFTAAPPGQYGTHHINLQERGYWVERFENRGANYLPEESESLTARLDGQIQEKTWPVENIMVFEAEYDD